MSCTLNNSCEQGDGVIRFDAQHAVFVEFSQIVAGASAKIERARLLTHYIEDCRAQQMAYSIPHPHEGNLYMSANITLYNK